MTPADLDRIVERHLNAWFADGVSTPGDGKPTLRDRCADMIREALALRDKQWQAVHHLNNPPFIRDCSHHGAPDL